MRVNLEDDSFSCGTEGLVPSTEIPIHSAIYKARKDIHAILHAHSPSLVTFSIAKNVPNLMLLARATEICGKTAIAGYGCPGSDKLVFLIIIIIIITIMFIC